MGTISINSNVASLGAQRQLASASTSLTTSFERLASGQRINRASDDAAGLSVANQLNAKGRLYGVAIRNITDAASAIGIASSALQTQSSLLDRLGELATQSMNGTLSDVQRQTLDREYQQLVREFGRLGDTSAFNGIELLRNGRGGASMGSRMFQAGVDGSARSLLAINFGDSGTLSGNLLVTGDLVGIGHNSGDPDLAPDGQMTLDDILYAVNLISGSVSDMSRSELETISRNQLASFTVTDSSGGQRNLLMTTLRANSDGVWAVVFEDIGTDQLSFAGVSLLGTIGASDGNFRVSGGSTIALDFGGGKTGSLALDYNFSGYDPQFGGSGTTSAINFSRVSSVEAAGLALDTISARRAEITSLLSTLGASESRLFTALAVVRTSREAVAQAESRIRDADISAESARLTLEQIRQNAATSVLAQANQQPGLALKLLENA